MEPARPASADESAWPPGPDAAEQPGEPRVDRPNSVSPEDAADFRHQAPTHREQRSARERRADGAEPDADSEYWGWRYQARGWDAVFQASPLQRQKDQRARLARGEAVARVQEAKAALVR